MIVLRCRKTSADKECLSTSRSIESSGGALISAKREELVFNCSTNAAVELMDETGVCINVCKDEHSVNVMKKDDMQWKEKTL